MAHNDDHPRRRLISIASRLCERSEAIHVTSQIAASFHCGVMTYKDEWLRDGDAKRLCESEWSSLEI